MLGRSLTRRLRLIGQTVAVDDAELVRAIEDNAAELLMAMGAAGGGVQRDTPDARWTIGGSPIGYHNAVVTAALEDADAAIAESLAELTKHDVPGSWHVGPSMRPGDLGERLMAGGFASGGSEPGMAVRMTVPEARRRGIRYAGNGRARSGAS